MLLKKHILPFGVFLLLCCFPLFWDLGTLPIRLCDESRLAMNALEMLDNGNYLVTHYNGEPDIWNTKPPLMIWFQVFFLKIIGTNEWAIRLPSALAGLLTILSLVYFAKKQFDDINLGFIIGLVLVTSVGYVGVHITRTGDYDALLTLWTSLYALFFFRFIHSENPLKKRRFLLLSMVCIVLAVWTKSIAGLLLLPALFFYALFQKQLIPILKNKWLYIGGLGTIALIAVYYISREYVSVGYLEAVSNNELGGRFAEASENAGGSFGFYFKALWQERFTAWLAFIPLAGLFVLQNKKYRNLFIFSFLNAFSFLLIISISQTKLYWYDAPVYPFLAILVALGIYPLVQLVAKHFSKIVAYGLVFSIFFVPYRAIIQQTYQPKNRIHNAEIFGVSTYLQWQVKGKTKPQFTIAYEDKYTHVEFYTTILNRNGAKILIKKPADLDSTDTHVIACEKVAKEYIEKHYQHTILEERIGLYYSDARDLNVAQYMWGYYNIQSDNGATRYSLKWEERSEENQD